MPFTKAFEAWYSRHWNGVQNLHGYQHSEYKRALFNAWKAGQRVAAFPMRNQK